MEKSEVNNTIVTQNYNRLDNYVDVKDYLGLMPQDCSFDAALLPFLFVTTSRSGLTCRSNK